jgi:hypothetical protein
VKSKIRCSSVKKIVERLESMSFVSLRATDSGRKGVPREAAESRDSS